MDMNRGQVWTVSSLRCARCMIHVHADNTTIMITTTVIITRTRTTAPSLITRAKSKWVPVSLCWLSLSVAQFLSGFWYTLYEPTRPTIMPIMPEKPSCFFRPPILYIAQNPGVTRRKSARLAIKFRRAFFCFSGSSFFALCTLKKPKISTIRSAPYAKNWKVLL